MMDLFFVVTTGLALAACVWLLFRPAHRGDRPR